jgi:DNA-binding transcriptional ArsR family regulator
MGTKQNLTHHFKVLREAGLIKARYEGRNKLFGCAATSSTTCSQGSLTVY